MQRMHERRSVTADGSTPGQRGTARRGLPPRLTPASNPEIEAARWAICVSRQSLVSSSSAGSVHVSLRAFQNLSRLDRGRRSKSRWNSAVVSTADTAGRVNVNMRECEGREGDVDVDVTVINCRVSLDRHIDQPPL
ncbi:hypothetical protein HL42_3637 [Trichophyton rubrum]|nr:hypothetical protein HL42_3637 [Trichophyton rubrum]